MVGWRGGEEDEGNNEPSFILDSHLLLYFFFKEIVFHRF